MKTIRLLAVSASLVALPGLALAQGCSGAKHDTQAQSCVTGTSWDDTSQSCKPVANS